MKENNTLFDIETPEQKRLYKFKQSNSKSGEYSTRLRPETAEKVKEYCRIHNLNCKYFINDVLDEKMAELEQTKYDGLTKEELIDLLKRMESERHDQH